MTSEEKEQACFNDVEWDEIQARDAESEERAKLDRADEAKKRMRGGVMEPAFDGDSVRLTRTMAAASTALQVLGIQRGYTTEQRQSFYDLWKASDDLATAARIFNNLIAGE